MREDFIILLRNNNIASNEVMGKVDLPVAGDIEVGMLTLDREAWRIMEN
jgi:hypothetical protein